MALDCATHPNTRQRLDTPESSEIDVSTPFQYAFEPYSDRCLGQSET